MYSNIIYVLATLCLFIGSLLTFERELPDYFYMTGTTLFLVKSLISLYYDIKNRNKRIFYDELI